MERLRTSVHTYINCNNVHNQACVHVCSGEVEEEGCQGARKGRGADRPDLTKKLRSGGQSLQRL